MIVGFLTALGAMGTLEVDPTASVVSQTLIALVGLAIAFSGVHALNRSSSNG
jgi:hypothetical protein